MKYSITLAHEIAKLHNWTGTRRRTVTLPDGESKATLVFGRKPVFLDYLPEEVKNDAKLVVAEVSEATEEEEATAPTASKAAAKPHFASKGKK